MTRVRKKKLNKYLISVLILAAINLIVLFIIFGVSETATTEIGLIVETTRWIGGMKYNPEAISEVATRPLAPVLNLPFMALGERTGLVIQSIIFYLLCVYFVFKITELVYKNKNQALLASILFAFAVPALKHSLSFHVTDVGSWFFYIFSIYLTLLYLKKRDEKLIIFNGLICGIGVLMKESGGLGIIFFTVIILLSGEFKLKERFLKIIKFGVSSLIVLVPWEVFLLVFTPYSHLSIISFAKGDYIAGAPTKVWHALQHVLALFATFGLIGWSLILWGALKEWKNKNKERIKILLALVPFSFICLAWPAADSRHAFIVGTLGVLLASYGLINIKNIFKNKKIGLILIISILLIYIVFNYFSCYTDDSIPFVDFENLLYFLKIPN